MIQITTHDKQFAVRAAYADRDRIKGIPGARWNGTHMVWTLPATENTVRNILSTFIMTEIKADEAFDILIKKTQDICRNAILSVNNTTQPAIRKTDAWGHQLKAYHFAYNMPACMLAMAMGTGKSKVTVDLVMNWGVKRVLITCPKSVLNVWRSEFERHADPTTYMIFNSSKGSCKQRAAKIREFLQIASALKKLAIVVVNHEAVWRADMAKMIFAARFDLVVCDECVPAGTRIATVDGERNIEDLKIGDMVLGYNHETGAMDETPVMYCFQHITHSPLVQVCDTQLTPNHPVWTEERGYVSSGRLDAMQCTVVKLHRGEANDKRVQSNMRTVQKRVYSSGAEGTGRKTAILQQGMFEQVEYIKAGGAGKITADNERDTAKGGCAIEAIRTPALGLEPVQQSYCAKKSTAGIEGDGLYHAKRRERDGRDASSEAISDAVGVAGGVCCKDRNEGQRLSNMLQDRHSGADIKDSRGGGRGITPHTIKSDARCKENSVSGIAGMDGNPFLEQGNQGRLGCSNGKSDAGRQVYNIETGSGNYFANGLLVHNCHRGKAPGGQFSRFLSRLGDAVPRRLGLTGTPMPHSPLDIYAQYRFLDKGIYGTSFTLFRARYAVMGGYQNHQVLGFQNEADLRQRFERIAFQVKADVLDLPEAVHTYRDIELDPATAKAYKQMYDTFVVEVKEGTVTASNALSKLLRLQQITSGYLPVDDTVSQIGTEKRQALADIFEDLDAREPVVVFARFRHDLDQIKAAVEESGRTYAELSGRGNDLQAWQEGKFDVIGVQIQAGGVGISLVRARYCVYYSMGYSLGDYEQSLARVHRPGQKQNVTYIHLVATGTVDEKVYKALQKRKQVIEDLLEGVK